MEVVALGPFYVASLPWQRQSREWMLTVVCKATFDLVQGELRLASGQEPINDADNHWDDDPRRSVYSPNDLVPFKKGADVTLVGHAFAPHHKPCRSLTARLVVGSIDKAVEVYADRTWNGESQIVEGQPFAHMPLRYERAPGGPGTPNPVGIPRAPGPLPNLQSSLRRGATLQSDSTPLGFGPIAADWPQRAERLRRHRASFPHTGWHGHPLPDDIDGEYFNVSPADQRLAEIAPDQDMLLEHLHPDHARLATRLPGMRPQAFVERPHAAAQELAMVADGLWIDTDRSICTVTWRGKLPLVSRDERGRVLVAMAGARQKITWEDVTRLGRALGKPPQSTRPAPLAPAAPAAPRAPRAPEREVFEEESVETEVLNSADIARMEGMNVPAWLTPPRPRAAGAKPQAPPTARPAPPAPPAPPVPPMPPARPPATTLPFVQPQPPAPPPPPPVPPVPPAPSAATTQPLPAPAPAFTSPAPIAPPAEVPRSPPAEAAPQASPPRETSPWAAAAGSAAIGPPTHFPVATPQAAPSAPPQDEPRPRVPARASRKAGPDIVDLLWFDPQASARIRAAFPAIIDELEFEPIDPKHDLPTDDPYASRDRHDVFGVLTRAPATDGRGMGRAMLDAINETGRFTPPLVVLSGELRFPFDELEVLKVTVAAIAPLVTEDNKKLKDALESANEVLKTPLLQAPANVEGATGEMRDALRQGRRAISSGQLDAHIERVLLEQRRYQKRTVFGDEQIRSLCLPSGETSPIPAYLPFALSTKLPLMTRMKARLIAEAHAQQDQYEAHPHGLKVVALGRIVSIDGWRA
ncbi:DUF2169 domain-containing protein [Polyangium aurulentum]|uniref:DUF2169 domain-containing protein n=1 Tax=Polyangium aurulentum TaxID=2567896 RepID=UPI00146DB838|nr:DUF2169 domain-containing protein [Polyangium aurulentum]UQA55271.1 DUF2169 domain-containing protein [Polyangium aurulentum]